MSRVSFLTMKANEAQTLIGQKVIVEHRGMLLPGKISGIPDKFKWRDVLIQFPAEKKPRQFNASKVSTVK